MIKHSCDRKVETQRVSIHWGLIDIQVIGATQNWRENTQEVGSETANKWEQDLQNKTGSPMRRVNKRTTS